MAAGISQEELAERAALSAHGISDLERGARSRPYPDTIRRLAEALGLTETEHAELRAAGRRVGAAGFSGAAGVSQSSLLPKSLTSFVGREREVAAVAERLRDPSVRLLTLIGPGGAGKTRLAIEAAADGGQLFPDGVSFVDLSPLRDTSQVVALIARKVGVWDLGQRYVAESLQLYLREKQALLLLDNFEHLLPAAPDVCDLLASCPGLKALVTSRAALRVQGEHVYLVPPLNLPPPIDRPTAHLFGTYPAVALFVQRAAAVCPDFQLSDDNAGVVAEICRRLDGLPLAIELAAARMRLLDPQAMLTRLERRLPLLTGGTRDLPERQRTLRDTIDWSYELLDEAERGLFRGLSTFVGGAALEAIEAVCDGGGALASDILDRVASLIDKSLVRRIDGPDREPRFVMLETVREFALEQLEASDEAEPLRRRHAEYFLEFAELARSQLRRPHGAVWLNRFEAEHDNLRAAIEWGQTLPEQSHEGHCDDEAQSGVEIAARIARAAEWFWRLRGHLREGKECVDRLLVRAPAGTTAHAGALVVAGSLARQMGNHDEARQRTNEALSAWRTLGDRDRLAEVLARAAEVHGRLGELDRAKVLLEESRTVSGDNRHQGDLDHPLVCVQALAVWAAGDLDAARHLFEQTLALGRADGDVHTIQFALRFLGLLARQRRELEQARTNYREALILAREFGDRSCMMYELAGLAYVAADLNHAERAARLLAAVSRLHELMGVTLSATSGAGGFEQSVTALRALLGDSAFDAAWSEGSAMSLDEAVVYACDEAPMA